MNTDSVGGYRLRWGSWSQTKMGVGITHLYRGKESNSWTQVERRLSRGLQTKIGVGVTD